MAVEAKRGCGYRKVDGLYLVGGYVACPCDRLPFRLESCPVCGAGVHFTRSVTEINPLKLFGPHHECTDLVVPCPVCEPEDAIAFVMMVGEKYYPTPADFIREAQAQGISKRIPFIPKHMEIGKTWVFLAHNKACTVQEQPLLQYALEVTGETQTKLLDVPKETKALGIFAAFKPQRIEKIVNESELTKEVRADLEKRGITPVPVPDSDHDHH